MSFEESPIAVKKVEEHLEVYNKNLGELTILLIRCLTQIDSSNQWSNHEVMGLTLRSELQRFGVLYKEVHLPETEEFLKQMQSFMENYTGEMEKEDFCADFDSICRDASKLSDQATRVAALHLCLYMDSLEVVRRAVEEEVPAELGAKGQDREASLKRDKSRSILSKCTVVVTAATLLVVGSAVGSSQKNASMFFLLTPPVVMVFGAVAAGCRLDFFAQPAAKREGHVLCQRGATKGSDTNIGERVNGCIKAVSLALSRASQFLEVIKNEVQGYTGRPGVLEPARHFEKMKYGAERLVVMCKQSRGAVLQIQKGLGIASHSMGTHNTYIPAWLNKHKEDLKALSLHDLECRVGLRMPFTFTSSEAVTLPLKVGMEQGGRLLLTGPRVYDEM